MEAQQHGSSRICQDKQEETETFLKQDKQRTPVYKVLVTDTFVAGTGDKLFITVPSPVVYKEAREANTDDEVKEMVKKIHEEQENQEDEKVVDEKFR